MKVRSKGLLGRACSPAFLAIVAYVVAVQCAGVEARKPNVVFVLVDDMGYHDVGYHNCEYPTPNIDSLADQGVKLENYYVRYMCTPTRATFLTGRYTTFTGLGHWASYHNQARGVPLEYPLLPEFLKEQGYATHIVGKWHLGYHTTDYLPTNRGFDTFYGILGGYSDHYNYSVCVGPYCGYDLHNMLEDEEEDMGQYSTELFTDKAVDIANAASGSSQPFFLYLAYSSPHFPLQAPPEKYAQFDYITNPRRRMYAAMMASIDEGLGTLTQALKDNDQWKDTVFIFSSDNGGALPYAGSNYPYRGGKLTLFEGGIKSPGFVTGPVVQRHGVTSVELMDVTDWFPTIADLIGVPKADLASYNFDGVSQWHMINHGGPSQRDEIVYQIDIVEEPVGERLYDDSFDNRISAAIRVGDYKLLTGATGMGYVGISPGDVSLFTKYVMGLTQSFPAGKNIWLYDIANDPMEINDLSAQKPDLVKTMLDRLQVYHESSIDLTAAELYPPGDPNSDPSLGSGFWNPWLE